MSETPDLIPDGRPTAPAGEYRLTPIDFYRATLHCRRCKSPYKVPRLAERFLYWWCHRSEDGARCQTMNIWGKEAS